MTGSHEALPAGRPARSERRSVSVRFRILVAILLVSAVGLAVTGAASYLVQRQRALTAVDAQLSRSVVALKAVAQQVGADTSHTSVDAVLRAAMQRLVPPENQAVIGLVNFAPAYAPSTKRAFQIQDDPELLKRVVVEASSSSVVRGTAKSSIGTVRYVIVPVNVSGDKRLGLYVAAVNLDAVLADVAQSFQGFLVVALFALVLIGLVAWFVAGRLLRPIRLLRDAAAAHSAADLSARIPVTGNDDISELAVTINGMFDRLEDSFASQRRLIDDVRHELKTPITIVRGNLELLDSSDQADVDAVRAVALDELGRMSSLVSELSLLAEARRPDFVELAPMDVNDFTAAVAIKVRALDPLRTWPVFVGSSGTAMVDAQRLTQAWLQLADNAAKYATKNTPISIGSDIGLDGGVEWLYLWVRDSGPGIPAHSHARIFERFGRLESNRGTAGSGLGLTIVLAIAEAHGGTVTLSSELGQGSTFTIRVPLNGQADTAGLA
ncbi:sensor histidine kinase [Parafrigoribacterium soli]|uniref:sensor histidine kinase n=1 Tax=Parafrigoribacterium soli TaxID=3144663 RepID=UPI0032EB2870